MQFILREIFLSVFERVKIKLKNATMTVSIRESRMSSFKTFRYMLNHIRSCNWNLMSFSKQSFQIIMLSSINVCFCLKFRIYSDGTFSFKICFMKSFISMGAL